MTLVLLFEQPVERSSSPAGSTALREVQTFLHQLRHSAPSGFDPAEKGQLEPTAPALPLVPNLEVVLAGYRSGAVDASAQGGNLIYLKPNGDEIQPLPLPSSPGSGQAEPGGGDGSPSSYANDWGSALFSAPAAAFAAVAPWLLRSAGTSGPVLAIHTTYGSGAGSAEIEQAAGILRTAMDLCGAPGWLCNLWLTETERICCFGEAALGPDTSPLIKSLFRMSSPLGTAGIEILDSGRPYGPAPTVTPAPGASQFSGSPSGRCFEAAPVLAGSVIARFAEAVISSAGSRSVGAHDADIDLRAFLLPKDGEPIEGCQDALSVHANGRTLAIADGAGTASYSAEWARALSRHAVLSPPRFSPELETTQRPAAAIEEPIPTRPSTLPVPPAVAAQATLLKAWLDQAIIDWAPEVPWERLLRPATYNKAKAGSGATLAGIEFLGPAPSGGVRFRAWALGDSCVIHARGGALLSSRPVARAVDFGYDPKLLMTRPGFEAKYALAWQDWEEVLQAGDWLILATDAMSEYILRQFETGAAADLLSRFAGFLALPSPEGWRQIEGLVQARRAQGDLRNDDVGLALLRLRE